MAHISRLSRKPKRPIIIPAQDQLQIGVDKHGHPVWVDCKDLINTEADDEALAHNRASALDESALQKMVQAVLENATRFADETFRNVAPRTVIERLDAGDIAAWGEWLNSVGFRVIQDGLKTVVKMSGRVIRELDANVDKRFAEAVAQRVNVIVKMPEPGKPSTN